jgi:hypothetical protein
MDFEENEHPKNDKTLVNKNYIEEEQTSQDPIDINKPLYTNRGKDLNNNSYMSIERHNGKAYGLLRSFYIEIMNSRNSQYHIIPAIIYILALIALEFLILQIIIMIKPFLLLERVEMITFVSLIFFGISAGWILKNVLLYDFSSKKNIFFADLISLILLFFIIFTKSLYILFLCYPIISILFGFVLFTARNLFEDYYIKPFKDPLDGQIDFSLRTNRNLLLSIPNFSSFIAVSYIYIISPDLDQINWNFGFIFYGVIILTICILIFFIKESPIILYRNKQIEHMFHILEEINEKPIDEEERQLIESDIQAIIKIQDSTTYMSFFINSPNDSQDTSRLSFIYFAAIFACAYCCITILISIPQRIRITILPGPSYNINFYVRIFVFFIISCWGFLFGTVLLRFIKIPLKVLLIILFSIVFILGFFLVFWFNYSYLTAAFMLFFSYSISIVLMNYGVITYKMKLQEKVEKFYDFSFYFFAAFSVIIFEVFNSINFQAGYITTLVFAAGGILCSALLDK